MSGYASNYATETVGLRGYENGSLTPVAVDNNRTRSGAYAYNRFNT